MRTGVRYNVNNVKCMQIFIVDDFNYTGMVIVKLCLKCFLIKHKTREYEINGKPV